MTTNKTEARGLEVFNFSEKSASIRVQVINGEPWFVAKDIALTLGYTNPRKAINDHCKEKGVTFCDTLTEGGLQRIKFINEGNVYRLIINCTLPMADVFESWLFDKVLPSIRKTGCYADRPEVINGVEPIVYGGRAWYPYADALRSMGLGTRSSAWRRKSAMPEHFCLICGRNFITAQYFRTLLAYNAWKQQYSQLEMVFCDEKPDKMV